jgi:hypothetical protein
VSSGFVGPKSSPKNLLTAKHAKYANGNNFLVVGELAVHAAFHVGGGFGDLHFSRCPFPSAMNSRGFGWIGWNAGSLSPRGRASQVV